MPTLEIAKDAVPRIADVYFDNDFYTNYLLNIRNQPEDAVEKLQLVFTDEDMPRSAVATYSPPFSEDTDNHVIRMSPTRLPWMIYEQGNTLRHETEHFIQANRRGYFAWETGKLIVASASVVGSGLFLGAEGFDSASGILTEMPDTAVFAKNALGAALGSVLGVGVGAGIVYCADFFSICEIKARRAEKTKRDLLPDGTLRVAFKYSS